MSANHAAPQQTGHDADLVRSGNVKHVKCSAARAGYLPVKLERVPAPSLSNIAVYLRPEGDDKNFTLYRDSAHEFTEHVKERLIASGVEFVYIPMAEQSKFRAQIEHQLVDSMADPAMVVSEKSTLLYETALEMVNDLLTDSDLAAKSQRVERVSRAVTTLVMNEPSSFAHLFAASHHDFYTATHMVNVATWMVSLAYALGERDQNKLDEICQAGLLHDMGKLYVPETILNKSGKLSDDEWAAIRKHPEEGYKHLQQFSEVSDLILKVTLQHHERMDGTGYPHGVKGEDIHPMARLCAVVDSFDAMTAFRPFKKQATSVSTAIDILRKETPAKYDPKMVEAWIALLGSAGAALPTTPQADDAPAPAAANADASKPKKPPAKGDASDRRTSERFSFICPVRMEIVGGDHKGPLGFPATTHNISRSGFGMLSQQPVELATRIRVHLVGIQANSATKKILEGETVRCRAYSDGWYDIGVELVKEVKAELPIAA
ncbi:MAG TPA: HD domain-containing phosphohydrolase [Phycisphaerales bacterium]|nr:HD domain-containing phosphohydrolase [Phycisphaerales bacterium]